MAKKRSLPQEPSPPCEVRDSAKKGRGVYALRRFSPGDLVVEITGQIIVEKEYPGSLYCMDLSPGYILEPHAPCSFLNHSCDPNCELVEFTKTSLALMAIVNIEPDRELTFDYAWSADVGPHRCHCGSLKCRKYIVEAGEEHSKLLRQIASAKKRRKNKKAAKRAKPTGSPSATETNGKTQKPSNRKAPKSAATKAEKSANGKKPTTAGSPAASNGHTLSGPPENGHATNSHRTNGNGNSHATNGHTTKRLSLVTQPSNAVTQPSKAKRR